MESKRQKQVSKLIQKELGDIFHKDFRALFENDFVTITDVKISPDLSVAKVYLSFLKGENKNHITEQINLNTKKIRGVFGQKNKNQLRIMPNFSFYVDDTAEYAQKIEELFAGIHIPPLDPDDKDL
jgi:ribosome-binding factor A